MSDMTNQKIKEAAREQTRGNILTLFFVSLFWGIVIGAMVLLLVLGPIFILVVALISVLVAGIIEYSAAANQNRMFKREYASIGAGFSGFSKPWISIGTYFMRSILLLLWLLIPIAGFYFVIERCYAYSCAMLIVQEDKDKGPIEAIIESKKIMNGRKWRMFCLDVYYFFVWYLGLGIITLGIAYVWGVPRHMQARYNLYKEASKERRLQVA